MILSLLDPILEFEDWNLEGLLLNFCKPYVDRSKLFLVFWLLYQAEVTLEVSLVLLFFAERLIPCHQQVVEHQISDDLEYPFYWELYAHLVLRNPRVQVKIVYLRVQNNYLSVHRRVLTKIIPSNRVSYRRIKSRLPSLQEPMNDKRKNSHYRAFLHFEYPGLRLHHAIVQKFEHFIIQSFILFPKRNQIRWDQVVLILIITVVSENFGIVYVHHCLLLVHHMKHLTYRYLLVV